jgi:amino acid permease
LVYYDPMNMNIAGSLVVVLMVLFFGLVFAMFPRWGMRLVCRSASSYMKEDLSSDPVYVVAFRFYGIAAVGMGLYALYQVLQAL